MIAQRFSLIGLVGLASAMVPPGAYASQAPKTETPKSNAVSETAPTRKLTQAELEKQFEESLTGATLEGIWQMTGKGGLRGNAPLTEPKKERYTITTVTKTGTEHWIVTARIQFAENDVAVPVLVRVLWAGDTPMITIDDLAIPLIGTYSARVMFHNGFYTGIWYSNNRNYGGVMSGRIVKLIAKPKKIEETPSK